MSNVATLPIEFNRKFSLHLYWASHELLLLRSNQTNEHPTRIDILFGDVRWLTIPAWLDGIRIERGQLSDIPLPLTAKIKEEAHFMSVFKIISQGITHYILAGDGVCVAEDEISFGVNSSLLENLDFRAFAAPLWDKR